MFEGALQNALDGVWANTLGRLAWLVPDWLSWLFSYPADVWVIWGIALALGYVLGRWGPLAVLASGGLFAGAWFLGRRSKSASHAAPPQPKPAPRQAGPAPRRKTLLDRLLGRERDDHNG